MSKEEERRLFVLCRKGDQSARAKLIEHNLRLVAHIVKKYYTANKNQDDLISVGTIGLIKAIDSFDTTNGARFATYASKCLQNEILMYFRAQKKNSCEVSINETIDTDKDGNPDEAAYNAAVAEKQEQIVDDLMDLVPGLDEERLNTQVHATQYAYREIKTNIEEEEAETIRAYITENKTSHYLYLISGTKRYYPYASLAAQALGFVNAEGGMKLSEACKTAAQAAGVSRKELYKLLSGE